MKDITMNKTSAMDSIQHKDLRMLAQLNYIKKEREREKKAMRIECEKI